MTQAFGNVEYSYKNAKGKWVFAPSDRGRKIGARLKKRIEAHWDQPIFYYHLRRGSHVGALRKLRGKKYFARLDLENFFYSISRNRVARALRGLEFAGTERLAKWSTVKNPYAPPSYSLPYGFVQSPIVASLVLDASSLGAFLRELSMDMVVSVYVDDIALASNNRRTIERGYRKLKRLVVQSNFVINEGKSESPGLTVELFNCHLSRMKTLVTDERKELFYSVPRSALGQAAFVEYCAAVAEGNEQ